MILNLVLALFWLVLAISSLLYMLVHPGGDRLNVFGRDFPVIWVTAIAAFMFGYRMLRWWLLRVQKRARVLTTQIRGRTPRRAEEFNPEFDFSDGPEKDKKPE